MKTSPNQANKIKAKEFKHFLNFTPHLLIIQSKIAIYLNIRGKTWN